MFLEYYGLREQPFGVTPDLVVRVDPARKNFKTSTNPPKDTIPSVRAERQQSAPMEPLHPKGHVAGQPVAETSLHLP